MFNRSEKSIEGFISEITLAANKSKTLESIETFHCEFAFGEESFGQRREVFGQFGRRRNGVFDRDNGWCKRADILEIGLRFDIMRQQTVAGLRLAMDKLVVECICAAKTSEVLGGIFCTCVVLLTNAVALNVIKQRREATTLTTAMIGRLMDVVRKFFPKREMVSVRENGTTSLSTTELLESSCTILQLETEQGGKSTTVVESSVSCSCMV